jgi:heat shock protein HslJ
LEVSVPKPEPGKPTGRVTATGGVNVRSGPGTNYPVLGVAPFGIEGEIVGRSQDGQWWAVALASAPGTIGWVSAANVAVVNAENVPVLQPDPPAYVPPPPATPVFTPTPVPAPTATPAPQLSFWADQTTIDQGQCTNLNWSVENVQAVWVYPQGQQYEQYPREGQGSEQVCPQSSTTYEMRVLLRDGSVATQQVSITVNTQNPLADTSWEVISYNNGRGGVVSVIIDTRISARFGADNQVTGSAGCNDYSGTYQIGGSSLSFGPLGSSMRACGEPEGIMQQESEYLAALQSASTFELDGNRLTIRDGSGSTAAIMSR